MSALSSKAEATRAELNLRNLRRHDPAIDQVVYSTSYVTVYYNTGADWIKTGIEGPMFLFSRSQEPKFGFFVLNRQGLEYTKEFLTDESEVQIDGQFILYEPRPDADRATGIWIAEEKDRVELCRRMQELRQRATRPVHPPQRSPLDFLFASVSSPTKSASSSTQMPSPQPAPAVLPKAVPSTLDMLFASSAVAASTPPPRSPSKLASPQISAAPQSSNLSGVNLLDTLFKAASPKTQERFPPSAQSVESKPKDARDLLAMLGHSASSGPSNLSQSPSRAPSTSHAATDLPSPPASVSASVQAVKPAAFMPNGPVVSPSLESTATGSLVNTRSPFAPPLLSHDVFAKLPPITGAKKPPKSPAQTTSAAASHTTSKKATEPMPRVKETPASSSRLSEPVSPVSNGLSPKSKPTAGGPTAPPVVRRGSSSTTATETKSLPKVNRSDAVEWLDTAATRAKIGMGSYENEPMDQASFVKSLQELLSRPAFATSLYARYLERFEDEHSS